MKFEVEGNWAKLMFSTDVEKGRFLVWYEQTKENQPYADANDIELGFVDNFMATYAVIDPATIMALTNGLILQFGGRLFWDDLYQLRNFVDQLAEYGHTMFYTELV